MCVFPSFKAGKSSNRGGKLGSKKGNEDAAAAETVCVCVLVCVCVCARARARARARALLGYVLGEFLFAEF